MKSRMWMTGANALFALLFAVGAALQLNDPDPLRWIAIYLAALVSCLTWARTSWDWLVAAVALGWALWIALSLSEWVRPATMFQPMEAHGGAVEEARELFGLGMMVFWMTWLAISSRRRARALP